MMLIRGMLPRKARAPYYAVAEHALRDDAAEILSRRCRHAVTTSLTLMMPPAPIDA